MIAVVSHMAYHDPSLPALFHALADPTRLRVVETLCAGPVQAGTLAEPFDMALTSFLKHLRVLEGAGVIATQKTGRVRMVRLNPDRMAQAAEWFRDRRGLWEGRLDNLGDLLATRPATPP
jgi:DNA-binding transcriptional ArsR family regulator